MKPKQNPVFLFLLEEARSVTMLEIIEESILTPD